MKNIGKKEVKYLTLDEVLLYVILGCIVAAVVGIGVGYLLRKRIAEARIDPLKKKQNRLLMMQRKCLNLHQGKQKL